MNNERMVKFILACLMCGEGVPALTSDTHPDPVAMLLMEDPYVFEIALDEGLITPASDRLGMHYVTPKGLGLLE